METNTKRQLLYLMRNGDTDQFKIGITSNLNHRYSQIQTGCPEKLEIIKLWTHTQRKFIKRYETILHRYFEALGQRIRKNGEWFKLTQEQVSWLCQPNNVKEQNKIIDNISKKLLTL